MRLVVETIPLLPEVQRALQSHLVVAFTGQVLYLLSSQTLYGALLTVHLMMRYTPLNQEVRRAAVASCCGMRGPGGLSEPSSPTQRPFLDSSYAKV